MKRITRVTHAGVNPGERVWLDQHGHWTRDESLAFAFDDAEAEKRVRRIPHATTQSIENNVTKENGDV